MSMLGLSGAGESQGQCCESFLNKQGSMALRKLLAEFHDGTSHVAAAFTPGQPGAAREPTWQCKHAEQVLKSQAVLLQAALSHWQ